MKLQTVIKIWENLNNNDDNNIGPKSKNIVIKVFKNVIN